MGDKKKTEFKQSVCRFWQVMQQTFANFLQLSWDVFRILKYRVAQKECNTFDQ